MRLRYPCISILLCRYCCYISILIRSTHEFLCHRCAYHSKTLSREQAMGVFYTEVFYNRNSPYFLQHCSLSTNPPNSSASTVFLHHISSITLKGAVQEGHLSYFLKYFSYPPPEPSSRLKQWTFVFLHGLDLLPLSPFQFAPLFFLALPILSLSLLWPRKP